MTCLYDFMAFPSHFRRNDMNGRADRHWDTHQGVVNSGRTAHA